MTNLRTTLLAATLVAAAAPALADSHGKPGMQEMMAAGLMIPEMSAARGRELFAAKGCVVCHSVNGTGGEDAPPMDAENMDNPMNPFEFAARMWRGAAAMVAMQEDELGGQIELTGAELADIIAFVHDADEQKNFGEADIPEEIMNFMHHQGESDHHADGKADDHG